tara:strand:- start:82 stop:198 length:117 start_codon:yes stop_codon:yes gene_type:complete
MNYSKAATKMKIALSLEIFSDNQYAFHARFFAYNELSW